jgi:hypothetical protein
MISPLQSLPDVDYVKQRAAFRKRCGHRYVKRFLDNPTTLHLQSKEFPTLLVKTFINDCNFSGFTSNFRHLTILFSTKRIQNQSVF